MKVKRFSVFLLIAAVVIGAYAFLSSSYFRITEIEVVGNHRFNITDVTQYCGARMYDNLFAFNTYEAKKKLLKNYYFENVVFKKLYPGKLVITVEERVLSCYIEYMKGSYLYLDDCGRVLEVNTYFTENLPIITGMSFTEFTLGKVLESTNTESFDTVVTFARLFGRHSIENQTIRVDVRDNTNIKLFVYNIDVLFGTIDDADEKIRIMQAAIEKIPDYKDIHGTLDIRDITRDIPFKLSK